jgi:hypothetical protein
MIKYILIAHCRGGLCPYYHRYLECCIHDGTSPAVAVPKTGMPDWCPLNDIEDIKTIAQGRREAADEHCKNQCGLCDYTSNTDIVCPSRKAILGNAVGGKKRKI